MEVLTTCTFEVDEKEDVYLTAARAVELMALDDEKTVDEDDGAEEFRAE